MSYKAVMADLQRDKEDIIRFWNAYHSRGMEEKYYHFYLNNPAGKAMCWLLKKTDCDDIVGICSLFPRKISINHKIYLAGVAGDMFVAPAHRSLGPAIMLQKRIVSAVNKKELELIYCFPTPQAESVVKRVGYRRLGSLVRMAKVINVESYLLDKKLPENLVRIVSPILNFGIHYMSLDAWPVFNRKVICKRVSETDKRFDTLWTRVQSHFCIIGDRSAQYLQWRYLAVPTGNIFAAFDCTNDELLGYVACHVKEDILNIRDMILLNKDPLIFNCLFRKIFSYAKKISSISVNSHFLMKKEISARLHEYGFLRRNVGIKEMGYLYVSEEFAQQHDDILNVEDWFLMSGDDDT